MYRLSENGNAEISLFSRVEKGLVSTGVELPSLAVASVSHRWGQVSGHGKSQNQQVKLSRG